MVPPSTKIQKFRQFRGLPGGQSFGGKLAESYGKLQDDEALKNWLDTDVVPGSRWGNQSERDDSPGMYVLDSHKKTAVKRKRCWLEKPPAMFGGCPWDWSWAGRTSDFLRDSALQFLESDVSGQISSQTSRPSGKWNLPRILWEKCPQKCSTESWGLGFFLRMLFAQMFFLGVKFYLFFGRNHNNHRVFSTSPFSLLKLKSAPPTRWAPNTSFTPKNGRKSLGNWGHSALK